MNKILLTLLFIAIPGKMVFSQYSRGDAILNFTGSYVESYSSSGVTTSRYTGKNRTLDLGISVGLCISKNITAGMGLQYGHIHNETGFDFYYYQNFLLKERLDTKATLLAPQFYLNYNRQVIGKLWFSAGLQTTYGKMHSEYESISIGAKNFPDTVISADDPWNYMRDGKHHESNRIFSVSLRPEFSYFLTEKIGLKINLGGIQYTSYDFETYEWQVTLNPSSWEYGFFLRFEKKEPVSD